LGVILIKKRYVLPWQCVVSLLLCVALLQYIFAVKAVARQDRTVQELMSEGFYNFEENIDISEYSLTPNELLYSFLCVIKDAPYLFCVSRNLRYSYKTNGHVISLIPRYTMTKDEYEYAREYCIRRVKAMASLAEHFKSEVEKALFLHDFICENFEYDSSLENENVYEFLLMGKGTCEAYMLLYTAVLRECGIEAHFAASDSMAHIWNVVKLDGEWYYVDLTWDDSASSDTVSRRHFLCSDATATERGHKEWYLPVDVCCESEKYENFDFDELLKGDVTLGDVDHDGEVSLLDLLIIRGQQGSNDATDFCAFCADVDLNSVVDDGDVELLRRKLIVSD